MPQAHIDRDDTLSVMEKGGIVRSVTRLIRVTGLTDTSYTVLWSALAQLGVPTVPSTLPGVGFENLMLDERHAKIMDGNPDTVDVTLVYNHILETQELSASDESIGTGLVYGKMRCSVVQKKTNIYSDPKNPNVQPQQITVQHKFPKTDLDHPGQTIIQGGEVEVAVPQRTLTFGGYIPTSSPNAIADMLIASVNQKTWASQPPLTWMCMEVQWMLAGNKPGGGTPRYKFDFEFQNNEDGWEPYAVFIDARTNKPPPGLVPDVGYKQILYHFQADYNKVFAAYFEGGNSIS